MLKKFVFSTFFLPFLLSGTELKPWFENSLILESRSTLLYQSFNSLATTCHKTKYVSNDAFLTGSLAMYLDKYAGEVEMTLAATRKQHFNIDNIRLTGRYQIMDDILDDPVSLVAGLTLTQAGKPALYDPASFHHGLVNAEAHLAIGKEVEVCRDWYERYSALFGAGLSSGPPGAKPWLRANFSYAKNHFGCEIFEIFARTLFGLGGQRLKLHHFRGYGPINHQSIDIGANYTYLLEKIGGTMTGEYSYRLYAKNFPKNASRFAVTFFYPLGLGI